MHNVILTNRSDLFDITGVVDFGRCDHALIYGFLKPKVKIYPSKVITFRIFKNLEEYSFKSDVRHAMTNVELNNISSPNDQYSSWHKEITKVLDYHVTIKKMRGRERDVPYITPEWKEAIRKKRKYAKRYERLQTQESLDEMRYSVGEYRNSSKKKSD